MSENVKAVALPLVMALGLFCAGGCENRTEAYARLCERTNQAPHWHFVVYLDVNACLGCNEDMDAWRELVHLLREGNTGTVSIFSPRPDSVDVYWAMKLEQIGDTVHVLDGETLRALGWDRWATPVKALFDDACRPVQVGGRSDNEKHSHEFIQKMIRRIEDARGKGSPTGAEDSPRYFEYIFAEIEP